MFDAGYDVTRLAFLLADLPVELLGRLRSDRVLYFPAPPRAPGIRAKITCPAGEPKPSKPGPGRLPNQKTAARRTSRRRQAPQGEAVHEETG